MPSSDSMIHDIMMESSDTIIVSDPVEIDDGNNFKGNLELNEQETSNGSSGAEVDYVEGKVIREDVFQCLSRKGKYYRLVLTPNEILLQSQEGKSRSAMERYTIDDLFGCHTLRHKQNGPSFMSAYVCFYLYPRRKRVLLSKSKIRVRVPLVFEVRKSGNSYEENLMIATKWKEDALRLLRRKFPKWQKESNGLNGSGILTNAMEETLTEVNSNVISDRKVTPDIKQSKGTKLSLVNAISYVRKYLVIVNPVSGQGKGVSIFHKKVHPVLIEAGVKVELLITETAGQAKTTVATSSLADIDGIITVGGDGLLYEVVNGLRTRPDFDKVPVGAIATGSGNGLARSIAQYSKEDLEYLKNPVRLTTLAIARGKVIPVNLMEIELDGKKIAAFLSVGWGLMADIDVESEVLRAIGEPRFTVWSFLRLAKLRSYKAHLSYIPCEKIQRDEGNGSNSISLRKRDPVHVEGDFISVYSSCQSHIGTDLIFAPGAQPGDGLIHLTYLTKDAGRASATQFLLGIEKGNHLNVSDVNYVTVQEFTLSYPGGIGGILTVDGENVKGETIKVKISPNPLYVFAL